MSTDMTTDDAILGTVRASSWPSLFDCQLRWYWQNIMGLKLPYSGRSALGTVVHAGTAIFDEGRMAGGKADAGAAVDVAVSELRDKARDVEWDDRLTYRDAEQLAVKLTARYCIDEAPKHTFVGVELWCGKLDVVTEYGVIRLTGTTDRIRLLPDGRMGITDLKSGGRAVTKNAAGELVANTKGHHWQTGIYTLMAEAASGETLDAPAQVIGLQTTKEAPVASAEIADVKTPLIGTEEQPGLIAVAAKILKDGMFTPNPKSILCSAKYCAAHAQNKCIYHN